MKKRFFVLRSDRGTDSSYLDMYDSEKKYKSNQPPKRSISLKSCLHITAKPDSKDIKRKYGIGKLYFLL